MEEQLKGLSREVLLVTDTSDDCAVARKIINDRRTSLYPRPGGLLIYFIPVDGPSVRETFEALDLYLHRNIIEFTRGDIIKF